jgi:hypothetical protein
MEEYYDYSQHTHSLVFGTYQWYTTLSITMYLHEIASHEDKAYTTCIVNSFLNEDEVYEIP